MGAGKAGAKFVAAFVERAVEHMKDDQKEGWVHINI